VSAAEAWEELQLSRSTDHIDDNDFFQQLTTVEDAANLAGVKPSTVHNWITRGYVDRHGQRRWITGFHIEGVRRVLPLEVLRADTEIRRAGLGGLRKRPM
jgi:hypothetical protein